MKAAKRAKNPNTPEFVGKYYLTNAKLLPEVIRCKKLNRITNELAVMLMTLTRKYAQRPCFSGYSFKEDMICEALANLCQNALKFDPERSDNPFSFYTTCINNTFLQFLNHEKKHRRIRDELLIDLGENPSYNFADAAREQADGGEYKTEFEEMKQNIVDAKERVKNEAEQKAIADAEKAALLGTVDAKAVTEYFNFEEPMND